MEGERTAAIAGKPLPQLIRVRHRYCVESGPCGSGLARDSDSTGEEFFRPKHQAPWHFLNFLPLPHGQGSLRPTSFRALRTGSW